MLIFLLHYFRRCIIILKKFDRRPPSKADNTELNEMIKDKEVRLVDEDGNQVGIISSVEALAMANERKLDLVKIAPMAKPPVCKIMDYGKYRYELQKKEKQNRKNQKVVNIKEVRLSLNIDTHDIQTKVKIANKILKDGDKVKLSLRLRGRELGNVDMAIGVLNNFYDILGKENANMDSTPKLEGKSVVAVLSPN